MTLTKKRNESPRKKVTNLAEKNIFSRKNDSSRTLISQKKIRIS